MTRHFILRISLIVLLSFSCSLVSTGQYDFKEVEIKLDLNKLTLNKILINELTIEKVKDLLGEPSFEDKSWMSKVTGPKIYFHYDGIILWFNPKSTDPKQKLISMTVYLADTWDDENEDVFLAFPGKISPRLAGDFKIEDITPLFKNYKITIQSASDYRIERSKSYGDTSLYHHDFVFIENKNASLCFSCDETTKYLDYITISFQ